MITSGFIVVYKGKRESQLFKHISFYFITPCLPFKGIFLKNITFPTIHWFVVRNFFTLPIKIPFLLFLFIKWKIVCITIIWQFMIWYLRHFLLPNFGSFAYKTSNNFTLMLSGKKRKYFMVFSIILIDLLYYSSYLWLTINILMLFHFKKSLLIPLPILINLIS